MPNIREYTNGVGGLSPDNGMEQVAARNAAHVEGAYQKVGQELGSGIAAVGDAYDKIKTQQDISHGLAASAQSAAAMKTQMNVAFANSDPNDHTTGQRFMAETFEPWAKDFVDAFSTQEGREWATQHAAQYRSHFEEQTAAAQSIQAGQAAVKNYHGTVRGLSDMSLQDPSSMTMNLGLLDKTIEAIIASDPNLTAEQQATIRGNLRDEGRLEIGKGAFIGSARANPDAAMKDLQDGKYNGVFDATQQEQMFGFAQTLKREAQADQRTAEAETRRQQKEAFEAKASAMEAAMFQSDGSVAIPQGFYKDLTTLALLPGADAGRIAALRGAAAQATKEQIEGTFVRTDVGTWNDLAGRIGLAPTDPHALTHTQVNQAYADGKLSKSDWTFLKQAVESARGDPILHQSLTQLNQALERIKPLVGKANIYGQLDQSGTANFAALHYDTVQRFQQLVAGGMSAAEAEKVLEDPRDPRGIMAHLAAYQTGNKQGMNNIHARVSGTGGPYRTAPTNGFDNGRKPGESAADYLKRTGG